jgi:hypothetical protein
VTALRLFGVTGAPGRRGLPGRGAEVVVFRELAAVVAPAPYAAPGDAALGDYREVVERVFREQAVLPAPPGVVFRDRDVLTQWLELHYFTLLDALAFVEDRVVARVTVTPAPPAAGGAAGPAVPAGTAGPEGAEEGAARRARTEAVLHDVLRVLRRHAVATVAVGTAGGAGVDGEHGAAASFLVERSRWELFAELVPQEGDRLSEVALRVSGPWPPYDFVRMQFTN